MSTTPEQFNAIDEAFLREVTEALKGDHNDLRREAIILRASREARRASVTAQAERTIALEAIMREALETLEPFRREAYLWDAKKYTAPANTKEQLWPDEFTPVLTGGECRDECGHSNRNSELATFTMGDLRRARTAADKIRDALTEEKQT